MDSNIMGRVPYSNMMMDGDMMGQESMDHQMMGRNVYNIMSNKGMTPDMSNMMGQQMDSNIMGRDMMVDVMGRNMMGQDRTYQMKGRNMMDHQDVSHNMMDMSNDPLSSNSMNGLVMKSNINSNTGSWVST